MLDDTSKPGGWRRPYGQDGESMRKPVQNMVPTHDAFADLPRREHYWAPHVRTPYLVFVDVHRSASFF